MKERKYILKVGNAEVRDFNIPGGWYTVIRPSATLEKLKQFIEAFGVGEIYSVQLKPLPTHPLSEPDWMLQLREIFDAKVSIPFDSFEVNWKSLYQSGWTPEEAAESAIEELKGE